uniref:Poly [ADP-ribose] polymerase n=1 Tax=Eutreptiella gymnastica TaxID=73025 RepID=A0A7S1I875_9EUGL|mmetsp:Transcript_136977/g.238112  ORF Transcript_136977/g.238112 Transcript_136977/m.238112 type:complete len:878 (+) Transcript_136977:721-3354(+)
MPETKVEYAKSDRSRCTKPGCGETIEKDQLRIGTAVSYFGDSEKSYKWRHLCCFTARQIANIESIDTIDGIDDLAECDVALVKRLLNKELIDDVSLLKGNSSSIDTSTFANGECLPKEQETTSKRSDKNRKVSDNSDDDKKVQWQVKLEGGFTVMDETIATKVEAAYQAEIASINLKMGEWMYCIDIESSKQINLKTKRSREIRRFVEEPKEDPATWEWKREGTFVQYSATEAMQLEDAYHEVGERTTIAMRGIDYIFDFKSWTQTNNISGTSRVIRRRGGPKRKLDEDAGQGNRAAKRGKVKAEGTTLLASSPSSSSLATAVTAYSDVVNNDTKNQACSSSCEDKDEATSSSTPAGVKSASSSPNEASKSTSSSSKSRSSVGKTIKKGRGVVDEHSGLVDIGHIYEEGEAVYMAMLNQTNIGQNNNKFYIVQLIEADAGGKWWVWFRWGRVGQVGQSKQEPHSTLESAKASFEKKFFDKTRNDWDDREDFVKHAGKYHLMLMDYGDDTDETTAEKMAKLKAEMPETKLQERIASLVEMISDMRMMSHAMAELDIDTKKMPLGKIQKKQIRQALEIIAQIDSEINGRKQNRVLSDLSSQFYTIIPHDFGMRVPPTIGTRNEVISKMELLDTLADLEIASKMLNDAAAVRENPLDSTYKALNTVLKPLERGADTWKLLCEAVKNTHGPTHKTYTLEVLDILEVAREGEGARFAAGIRNRRLLWHGSRLSNMMGIFSMGLRVAPPEAPVTGYMFGKGVYFADVVSKSANYCHTSPSNDTGLLLLCDVAVGKPCTLMRAESMDKPPKGHHSVFGVGKMGPDGDYENPANSQSFDGAALHFGRCKPQKLSGPSDLLYNEYVVYDVSQIRLKYVFKMKFHYK